MNCEYVLIAKRLRMSDLLHAMTHSTPFFMTLQVDWKVASSATPNRFVVFRYSTGIAIRRSCLKQGFTLCNINSAVIIQPKASKELIIQNHNPTNKPSRIQTLYTTNQSINFANSQNQADEVATQDYLTTTFYHTIKSYKLVLIKSSE